VPGTVSKRYRVFLFLFKAVAETKAAKAKKIADAKTAKAKVKADNKAAGEKAEADAKAKKEAIVHVAK
jgi:hypothetical protein